MNGDTITKLQERVDRWGVANIPAVFPFEETGLLKQMSDFVEEVAARPQHFSTETSIHNT